MKLFRLFLASCLVAMAMGVFAQGETCATAVVINNLPYNTPVLQTESTCGAGDNYDNSHRCGNRFMRDEEFVYEYTPTADGCVTFGATPAPLNDAPMALFVTKGCPDGVQSQCIAQFTNPDNAANTPKPASVDAWLEAGNTYYIQVTAMSECFDFTFSATSGNCTDYPEGGDCDNAEELTSLPYSDNMSNCNHNGITKEGNECYSTFYNDSPTYLYKFTPTRETCFKIEGQTTDNTMRMTVHDTCPTYSNQSCFSTQYYYTFSKQTDFYTLDSGVTYYFAFSSSATCTGINVTFSEIGEVGNTCATAKEIQPTGGFYQYDDGTTRCKGDEYKDQTKYSCSSFYDAGNDFVFKYTSPGNECVGASYTTASRFSGYGGLYMFKDCPSVSNDTPLEFKEKCSSAVGETVSIDYTIKDPGTYYFVVSGRKRNSTVYDFDFVFNFYTATLDEKGVDCARAHQLPSSDYVLEEDINTFCKGDDYDPADACGYTIMEGSDYVLTYTAPKDFCGSITGKNVLGAGGITVLDQCPSSTASCFGAVSCFDQCDSIYMDVFFEAGKTYYIVGSSATE